MVFCNNCGTQMDDNATFCPACGTRAETPVTPDPNPVSGGYYAPPVDPKDHTGEFTAEDVSENKVIAMLPYLFGLFGLLLSLIAASDSKYAAFHSRQALKIIVLSTLNSIILLLTCWLIIPILVCGVFSIVLFVVKIICFIDVCKGHAKDAPIIDSFSFLK